MILLLLLLGACEQNVSMPVGPEGRIATSGIGEHGGGIPGSVVFYSARDGNLEVYAMNADGSGERRLTTDPGQDVWPDMSPDGHYVTFASNRSGNFEIYVLDLTDGSLLNVSQGSGTDTWPRFSPNGRKVAFHSDRDGNFEIYTVNVDGTGLHRVTNNPVLDQWPDWSPDGKQIAFRRGMDVYVIDALGEEQNPVALTNLPATLDQMPVWSPNGNQIAFMSFREGYCAVFLMTADGDTPENPAVNLTPKDPADPAAAWCSRAPAWSRNGQQIYFMSFRPSTGGAGANFVEIFVMNADGSNPSQLTFSPGEDGGPQVR
jgi:Tol biopolymer transport system component